MEKFSKFIVKNKLIIMGLILLLTIACIVAIMFVNINSDLFSYLPKGLPMSDGLTYMQDTFNMQGDAIVGIEGVNYNQMLNFTSQMQAQKGVKAGGVIWLGMFEQMRTLDIEKFASMTDKFPNTPTFNKWKERFDKDMTELDNLDMNAAVDEILKNEDILNLFYPKFDKEKGYQKDELGTYVVMLQLTVQTSSPEALAMIDRINDTILVGVPHEIGGSGRLTKDVFDSTIGEAWKYIIVAVLVMFVVLLIMTTSLVEPFVFMVTLGISIVLNMGSNIIFPSVSVITFAASSILQLGLSMDYAIFLMHAYTSERKKTLNNGLAMQRAIGKTFGTVMASALTTVGGFLALFFMKFKIGADLGMVLAKGVLLSMFTVLFLQPCLMLWTSKLNKKTEHRIYLPKFKRVGSYAVTHRKTIVALALLLIVPVIVMQQLVQLSYIKFIDEPKNPTQIQQIVKSMGNSVIVIVPADNVETNKEFLEEIKKIDNVQATMGIFGMMPSEFHNLVADFAAFTNDPLIRNLNIANMMPPEASMLSGFVGKGKTMYSILLNCPEESEEAVVALSAIKSLCQVKFATVDAKTNVTTNAVLNSDFYITGTAQAVEDLKTITPTDFAIVNLASILIILVVLFFTLKSIKLPVLLIAVIELGIYINLSICYLMGQHLNFMAYIIISSIQLGATVDYAILYTIKYKENLDKMPSKEAAYRALMESGNSILTSVALLGGCTLSVSLVTSNRIISEITVMIARGSVISGVLVLLVLPAILVMFTGNKRLKITTKTLKKLENVNFNPPQIDNGKKKKKKDMRKPVIEFNLIDDLPIGQEESLIKSKLIDDSLIVQEESLIKIKKH